MSSPTAWPKPRTSSLVNSFIPASLGLRVGTHLMPWLFEVKKALTVEVRAPLPTHRDRPPSLANLECPGFEHLVATFEAMARFGASHPPGRSDHHAYAGSGTNGDDFPRFEVNIEC